MEKTNWYAVFTASRAEKRVKERLEQARNRELFTCAKGRVCEGWIGEKVRSSCDYGVYFCPCF